MQSKVKSIKFHVIFMEFLREFFSYSILYHYVAVMSASGSNLEVIVFARRSPEREWILPGRSVDSTSFSNKRRVVGVMNDGTLSMALSLSASRTIRKLLYSKCF